MTFEDDFRKAQYDVFNKMSKIVRGGFVSVANAIIVGSPVLTGRFRQNWQASVNIPVLTTVLDNVITRKNAHGQPLENQFTNIENVGEKTTNYKISDTLYLTNNLPYAKPLEEGHSKKRGAGWVASTVNDGEQAILDSIGKL